MIDALALQNSIDSNLYRNETSPYQQQIVVRVDNENNNICIGLGFHITLEVTELPAFDLLDHQILCLNELQPKGPPIHVENPRGNYTYEWRDANGVLLVSNETSIFEVPKAGDYFVTAISNNNCERTRKTTVETSGIAIIESVDIVDLSENNSITVHVSGLGNYEFALDDINGDYQDENHFDMISGGKHTIYVRDKNNCGIQSEEVVILNISKFFTPNGDGINDTWQVNGVSSQPNSKIFIFDKFGKLLKQIDANGMGWDGIYNGKLLPSSDYWYMVELEDGRIQRGHFSLIRR
jgi:gliding motility-associated-like protein